MNMYNPAHPGEIIKDIIKGLREETNRPYPLEEVAKALDTTRKTLSAILNCRQSITVEMALKLGKAFNTTPDLWLSLQQQYDLAQTKIDIKKVKTLWKPKAVA